jgi:hypothetical protein
MRNTQIKLEEHALSSVKSLRKQLKMKDYSLNCIKTLLATKRSFAIKRGMIDSMCVICKKSIVKGSLSYGKQVATGVGVCFKNKYGYFGFSLCSEQCVEAAVQKLQNGYTLMNFLFDDERTRNLMLEAAKEEEQLQKVHVRVDDNGQQVYYNTFAETMRLRELQQLKKNAQLKKQTFHQIKYPNELDE